MRIGQKTTVILDLRSKGKERASRTMRPFLHGLGLALMMVHVGLGLSFGPS